MVAHLFDERDGAVEKMIAMAIAAAHRAERKSAAAVKRLLTIRSSRVSWWKRDHFDVGETRMVIQQCN